MVGNNTKQIVSVNVNAELDSMDAISALFCGVEVGKTVEIGNGEAKVKLQSISDALAFNGGIEINLLVTFAVGVASGVVGNMLYAAIRPGLKKLEINGRRTRVSEESIAEAIETIKKLVSQSADTDETKESKK